jgi:fatty acid desaturase
MAARTRDFNFNQAPRDRRESMRVLPDFAQPFLTWLSGKPLSDQEMPERTAGYQLFTGAITLFAGISMAIVSIQNGLTMRALLLPMAWLLIVSGARKLQLMIIHQCAHGNFSRNAKVNESLGVFLSFAFCITPFRIYRKEHMFDHHSRSHMTMKDPTVIFVVEHLGIRPGMTRREMWRQLFLKLFSPIFHTRTFFRRLKAQTRAPKGEFSVALAAWILVLTLAARAGHLITLALAVGVPMILLYQMSGAIRLCLEHTFLTERSREDSAWAHHNKFSRAIFLGDATPAAYLPVPKKICLWLIWTLRLLFVHLPCRMFVLTGDTLVHDFHHRLPQSRQWPNYIMARSRDAKAGTGSKLSYQEIWGMVPALNESFDSLRASKI